MKGSIHLDKEIEKIVRDGHRFSEDSLTLFCLKRECGTKEENPLPNGEAHLPRLAIRVPGRIAKAVVRNRFKRILREIFRRERNKIRPSTDFLLIVKPFAVEKRLTYFDLRERFESLCKKSGSWIAYEEP